MLDKRVELMLKTDRPEDARIGERGTMTSKTEKRGSFLSRAMPR
jgi:hypothetical protein